MGIVPVHVRNLLQLRRLQDKDSSFLDRIAFNSRVLIIEGISGSGKDTLQMYLKKILKDRNICDYSEGELLLSWNQLEIEGIFKLRLKFMQLFLNYVRNVVSQDKNAIFLLNRFHLSTYVLTVAKQPKLRREYYKILNALRTLPVHVFILQLGENEIEKKSLHPERSRAWQKFQQEIVKKDGFRNRVERYVWQQRLMLETAATQQIPYSVIKLPSAPEIGGEWVRIPKVQSIFRPRLRVNAVDAKFLLRKRELSRGLKETN